MAVDGYGLLREHALTGLPVLQTISAEDNDFWDQFWSENVTNVQDVFTLVPAAEIRLLREDVPANLATLCYKAVEKFVKAVENSCRTQQDQNTGEWPGFNARPLTFRVQRVI